MKKLLLSLLLMVFALTTIKAQLENSDQLTLEGEYNGKNLFVKNAYGPGGEGFCIFEILVNGKTTKDKINADMFMIDLVSLGLKKGEKITVEISHKLGCSPRLKPLIVNPGAIGTSDATNKEIAKFTIEGDYFFQNVFISNPGGPNGKGFGLKEILVNGKSLTIDINQPTFEINLFPFNFKDGDKIKIEFKYLKGYDPLILNPEALKK